MSSQKAGSKRSKVGQTGSGEVKPVQGKDSVRLKLVIEMTGEKDAVRAMIDRLRMAVERDGCTIDVEELPHT